METIEVSVIAAVRPTESLEKVVGALENIFPGLTLVIEDDHLKATGGLEPLRNFHRLLREERILDAARSVMLKGLIGDAVLFRLSKQAAAAGRINFPPTEEPLGSVHVQIKGHDRLIDWLAPETAEGRPIEEIELDDHD